MARDMGAPPLSAIAVVKVRVRDINDNAPTFFTMNYSAIVHVSYFLSTLLIFVAFFYAILEFVQLLAILLSLFY